MIRQSCANAFVLKKVLYEKKLKIAVLPTCLAQEKKIPKAYQKL
jgi:hypothetical protein